MTAAASFEEFLAALPKVELHVHLEGSMQPATLLALAGKHRIGDLRRSLAEIRSWYAFRDFGHFLEVYRNAVRVLHDEDDFALLAAETARSLARQNVRYAEVNVSLSDHLERGIPAEVVFAGLERGRKQVEAEHDITIRWVPDFAGDYGVAAGEDTLAAVLAHGPASVLGLSIGGLEVDRDPFADLFARARAHGLRSLPHAGETEGPERVWSAIHALGAERIGHGIGSVRDAALVEHLRKQQLPLDVSPTSNLCTRSVPSLQEHPLPRMLEAGLLVTLNSDDPPMFGTDLTGEYRTAAAMGLDPAALAQLARNGVHASFAEPARKTALLAEIDAIPVPDAAAPSPPAAGSEDVL
ncbi:adenosine deaminase [Salinifilum ghardaiensis]